MKVNKKSISIWKKWSTFKRKTERKSLKANEKRFHLCREKNLILKSGDVFSLTTSGVNPINEYMVINAEGRTLLYKRLGLIQA
jgi:hypothetical protein